MIPLDTKVDINCFRGTIVGVGCKDGERYYMLLSEEGTVSLVPADVLEGKDETH